MFASPGDVAFSIGSYSLHWYGIIMAFAMFCGLFAISKIRGKFFPQIESDFVVDLSFYILISGILGARIYYVLASFSYYRNNPLEIFAVWNGGLSIHGAIIFATIAGVIFTWLRKKEIFQVADLMMFGLIIGQIIGRWGNFFNSEAFGLPTNLPWKLYIPLPQRPIQFLSVNYFHPTFLYESLANLIALVILFSILFCFAKKNKKTNGVIFFAYLFFYGLIRFFVEKLRIDSVLNVYGIPIAQIISVVFILCGLLGGIYLVYQQVKRNK